MVNFMDKREIVIVSGCRTAIGAFGESLRPVPAPKLSRHCNERSDRPRQILIPASLGMYGLVAV